jgi:tRNA dimethylallyltransferase
MNSNRPLQIKTPVIVLVGPTAIGKTALSFEIVHKFDCEIVSMDSMQVYRYMDIGTAKPTVRERQHVRHHLIDIVNPDEQYSAARFIKDCLQAIQKITAEKKIPLITGGTGLYLSSLIYGLFDNIHVEDEVRKRINKELTEKGLPCL